MHKQIQNKNRQLQEKIVERARNYQLHVFSFLIQHFGCKNLQKSDKKGTKHNYECKHAEYHANKLIPALYSLTMPSCLNTNKQGTDKGLREGFWVWLQLSFKAHYYILNIHYNYITTPFPSKQLDDKCNQLTLSLTVVMLFQNNSTII